MPIYAYRCAACGHAQDVLQKMSDPVLTVCPVCGASAYVKQLTAAGFQLKGSGWYVTDFREGNNAKKADAAKPADEGAGKAAEGGDPAAAKSDNKPDNKPDNKAADKPADKAAKPAGDSKTDSKPASAPASSPTAAPPPPSSSGT